MTKPKLIQLLLSIAMLLFVILDIFAKIRIAGVLPILLGLLMLQAACLSFMEYKSTKIKTYILTAVITAAACIMAFFASFYQIQNQFKRQTSSNKGEMYLQKAILTEEENAIARLLGANEDTYLLDFAVDDTVNTLSIITYELVDGSWHSISSSGMQLKDTSGKIALTFDNIADGMRTAIQSEHTGSSDKYSTNPEYNFEGMSRTTSYLTNRTYVTYDNEIPLVIQIHTTQDVVSSSDINYFFKPQQYQKLGYEKVYAITAVFSQMPLNELENIDKHAGD